MTTTHPTRGRVTDLLRRAVDESRARDDLYPLVYRELRKIAARRMRGEQVGHTLQATALVHEVYLRLAGDRQLNREGRRHFFGAAAEAMRRILVDHARRLRKEKRGGDRLHLTLSISDLIDDDDPGRVLALDEGLTRLAREDARAAEVARLRLFAGLAVEETAGAMRLSPRAVAREWSYARARLSQMLTDAREG